MFKLIIKQYIGLEHTQIEIHLYIHRGKSSLAGLLLASLATNGHSRHFVVTAPHARNVQALFVSLTRCLQALGQEGVTVLRDVDGHIKEVHMAAVTLQFVAASQCTAYVKCLLGMGCRVVVAIDEVCSPSVHTHTHT